jgi:hypothetical protein
MHNSEFFSSSTWKMWRHFLQVAMVSRRNPLSLKWVPPLKVVSFLSGLFFFAQTLMTCLGVDFFRFVLFGIFFASWLYA